MKYNGRSDYQHGEQARVGVLLVNLGTPAAPTAAAVRPWLRQFLGDPRVVEVPRLIWWLILNGIILLTRPRRSAANYAKIWTDQGSPLLVHTRAQLQALEQQLEQRYGDRLIVDYAFSYGEPSIPGQIQKLVNAGVQQLLVLPLYPQYSATTAGSVFDAVAESLKQQRWVPDVRFISHYHDRSDYIEALANSVRAFQAEAGRPDKLVMSFHGAPQFQLEKGDPYHCECQKTGRLLAESLGLGEDDYVICFQSRFGAAKWLQPYTDATLQALPEQGVKSVQVICPGFSVDCLETLEEIAMENHELFMQAGGESYQYIPCLNADPEHIEMLASLVSDNLGGWLPASTTEGR